MLYVFQTVFPSIIRSSKLHIQRQVFVRPILLPAVGLAVPAVNVQPSQINTAVNVQPSQINTAVNVQPSQINTAVNVQPSQSHLLVQHFLHF